jgi:ABC-type xylose transport system substrate-binding protein
VRRGVSPFLGQDGAVTPRTPFRRATALLAVLALGLTGCTTTTARSAGSSDGAGVIGVALPSTGDAGGVHAGEAVASELRDRGYRVDLQYAAGDARTQAAQVQNMLTKGMDAVIVAPLSADELEGPAEIAEEEGIPVLVLGRGLPVAGAGYAAVVEPEELGRAEAQALLDALDAGEGTDAMDPATSTDPGAADTPGPDATEPDVAEPDAAAPDAAEPDAGTPGGSASTAPSGPAQVTVLAGDENDAWEQRRHAAALDELAPAVDEGRIVIASGASWADAAVADAPLDVPAAAEERARGVAPDAPSSAVAILALGDDVTRGVVTALTTDPPTPSPAPTATPTPEPTGNRTVPIVVGSGADLATVRALDGGVLAATVFVDTREAAVPIADAVEALLDDGEPVADGTEIPGLVGIPAFAIGPQVLRADDVERVLVDTGWLSPEELSG